MALTSTSLAGALSQAGTRAVVAAAGTLAVGCLLKIDDEYARVSAISGTRVDLRRGLQGSAQVAHNTGAPVCYSLDDADFSWPIPPELYSYTAAGAITPSAGVHLIGVGAAGAIAYTLANPPADLPGMVIHLVSVSAYAHTVTLASAYTGSTETVFTFNNTVGSGVTLISRNAVWSHCSTSRLANESVSVAVADP